MAKGTLDQAKQIAEHSPTNQYFDEGDPRRVVRSPNYIVSPPHYRGGYAELDRRLSPRWPTTAEQRRRYRQRQRYFGSFCIACFGAAIAAVLSPVPILKYVGFALGGTIGMIAAVFAVYDFITREH